MVPEAALEVSKRTRHHLTVPKLTVDVCTLSLSLAHARITLQGGLPGMLPRGRRRLIEVRRGSS